MKLVIPVKRFPRGEGLGLPRRMTSLAAGFDLSAAVSSPLHIPPGESRLIPCGFGIALPPNYVGDIRPRSGLALKYQISVLNAPGTIDADYRGEIHVILVNHGRDVFTVRRGQQIAQLVVLPLPEVEFVEVEDLDTTERNQAGFGHTG